MFLLLCFGFLSVYGLISFVEFLVDLVVVIVCSITDNRIAFLDEFL